jgi:6-phosphogluconate dehydrogenase
MKIGFIGLGRMGKNMAIRLVEQGVQVVVWNRSREKINELFKELGIRNLELGEKKGIFSAGTITELLAKLPKPRILWLMVSHGQPVDEVISDLKKQGLEKGDIVIDGGNSYFKDSVRRYNELKKAGIHFLDVGTSGGLEGARNGACVMVGGDRDIFEKLKPIFETISTDGGYAYFGPAGAGHFVKMVHNGVEYGMLQAIGEGFEILEKGPYKLNLHKIADNWTKGSVVRGWLMDLLTKALSQDPRLENFKGSVGGGSTGEWTVKTATEEGVYAPIIEKSLEARIASQKKPTFAGKVISALRFGFGGHKE